MFTKPSKEIGFTVVEIVVTLLLVAIVSSVALSRILGGSTFNSVIVRDQIISLARTAQQNSLGRANVTLTITPSAGSDSVTIATSDGSTIESITTSLDSVSLSGDINDTDSCATTSGADSISNAAPMTLAFDELANLATSGVTGSTGAVTSALRICINNDALASVCVSPSGFAYAGNCDV